MADPCPFCGTPGTYVTADEGTSHFEPVRWHVAPGGNIPPQHAPARDPGVDWPAVEGLVDAAIRRGEITASRGAEILGLRLSTWRGRALEIRAENEFAGVTVGPCDRPHRRIARLPPGIPTCPICLYRNPGAEPGDTRPIGEHECNPEDIE